MQSSRLEIVKGVGHKVSTRLRVLAVNSLFPNDVQPYWGIFNACALEYLSELADVRVISPVKWCPGLGWALASERKLAKIPARAEYKGIPVTYPRFFRTPGFGRSWHGWLYAQSIKRHLRSVVQEFRPNVLLASWAHPDGYAVQQLGAQLGIPVVIKCLGSDIHQLLRDPSRKQQVLQALARCDRVITVSDSLKQIIAAEGIAPDKIARVYNGVDRTIFRPMPRSQARQALKLAPHGKILLCVAALLPIKRHCDLLRAFKLLLKQHPMEIRLVLVGEGPLRRELFRLATELGIAEHVRFAGGCKHHEVPTWINAADAVCLASQNEGLPNVLVEALACGRPVVATNVGGIPELVSSPRYGRLVNPGDPPALADAMNDVLATAWEPQRLCACPQVISWHESATELLNVLSSVHAQR
ncbi:MAG TPA: glycosyltransferase family 4 protein [Planctomycetota bacterium]|nr:glycosyltransferase family 4 protein [Planctomycetota bacterium]